MKFRLFSEREAAKQGAFPPAPSLKAFSTQLRRNITDIFQETLGLYYVDRTGYGVPVKTTDLWIQFDRIMRRESEEYANWTDQNRHFNPRLAVLNFILSATDLGVLDILDVGVAIIQQSADPLQRRNREYLNDWQIQLLATDALSEIDARLREHGTVYRVLDGTVVTSTEDFTHQVVIPAILVLGESGFENALREFHEALEAYRKAEYDTVLTKANHAFESTMKIIAGKMRWAYDDKATAAGMLDVMIANGLLPPMRDGAMKALVSMMKSDVPTLRNKMPSAGHGSGEKPMVIPEQFATYIISAAAANIRLLMDSYRAKRKSTK